MPKSLSFLINLFSISVLIYFEDSPLKNELMGTSFLNSEFGFKTASTK